MQHVLITYCTLKSIYFAEIAFICDVGAIKLTDICCQEGLFPTTTQALDSLCVGGGGGAFSMSDVNSDNYPSQSFKLE